MNFKKACFRVDASNLIGIGHVMRCITLANYFKKKGIISHFIMRSFPGNYLQIVKNNGHITHSLKLTNKATDITNASNNFIYKHWLGTSQKNDFLDSVKILNDIKPNLVIIDHYAIDKEWHNYLKENNSKIMVIDDLGDRYYDCNMLLDTTEGRLKKDYKNLTNKNCKLLLGARYSLIRDEFINLRKKSIIKYSKFKGIKKILISFGGSDPNNSTSKLLNIVSQWDESITINLILGKNFQYLKELKINKKKLKNKVNININVDNMAKILFDNDLVIGSPSVSAWERCGMGVPSIVIINSKNQEIVAKNLDKFGASINLGWIDKLKTKNVLSTLDSLKSSKRRMIQMSKSAYNLCDGNGKAQVYEEIKKLFR